MYAYLRNQGLELDEFGTLWTARGETVGVSAARAWAIQGQSPLYYLLIRGQSALLGDAEWALRLPSLLAGCALPLLGWLALRRAAGQRAGLCALVLLGFHPTLIYHAHQARPYAPAALGLGLAHWGASRAFASGAARDRALAWGGAVLAFYFHPLTGAALPALFLGAWVAETRGAPYSRRRIARDAVLAAVAALPALAHFVHLFTRRAALRWWGDPTWAQLLAIWPGALTILLLAAGVWLWRWGASARPPSPGRRLQPANLGLLTFELALFAITWAGAAAGELWVVRYLLAALVAGHYLLARALAGVGPFLVAIALGAAILPPSFQEYGGRVRQPIARWREACQAIDRLGEPGELMFLRSGFVEGDLTTRPPFTLPEHLPGFLVAPVAERPGDGHDPRPIVPLPYQWGGPRQGEALEAWAVPALEGSPGPRRLLVVAPEHVCRDFAGWLRWYFPGRVRPVAEAGPFFTLREPVMVLRLELSLADREQAGPGR